ncbi:MAG: phosphatase PAP2 family protein [Rhodanobacteraceae bacterium]|nr:MAG: phosphatase PAP2 family protein [Rhodanobacteraceae bacterium]
MNSNASALAPRRATTPWWPLVIACLLILIGFAGLLLPSVHALDIRTLLAMRHPADPSQLLGPRWLQEGLRDFMGLGGIGVLVLFIGTGIVLLWLAERRRDAGWFLGGVIGAFIIASVLKHVIGRPRPELIPHETYVFTASFPSGNTLMATVVWLLLALVLADATRRRLLREFAVLVALVIALLVGVSRVYMGVHWPSDVIEAWGLAMAWVWLLRRFWHAGVNGPR